MVAQDLIPYPGETQFVAFMRANYGALFPRLIDQSQFNRHRPQLAVVGRTVAPGMGRAVGDSNPPMCPTMPPNGLQSATSRRRNRRFAMQVMCSNRMSVLRLARNVPRANRLARRWFPLKGPAPLTIISGDSRHHPSTHSLYT